MNEFLIRLSKEYQDTGSGLVFANPLEMLVSTILSAQCTDKRVNIVTIGLFDRCRTAGDYLDLGEEKLEEIIRPCGLSKTKAKNIIKTCEMLITKYNSKVPQTMEELIVLPGVGRKTANVVLYNAFGKNTFAVDTHVFRVTRRMGLTDANTPEKVERDMCKIIPEHLWGKAHHWFIWHGRRVCHARTPDCKNCVVNDICPKMGL